MEHDGFSLDDKRQRVPDNDIPNVLECWAHRADKDFNMQRSARLAALKKQIAPLKRDRLEHQEIIHRLKFEEVVADDPEKARVSRENAEAELSELQARITPLQAEINQLGRQFWVDKKQVVANKYDLSASRHRDLERDDQFFEKSALTLKRLKLLGNATDHVVLTIEQILHKS
jgi:type I restriction enzyme M protein